MRVARRAVSLALTRFISAAREAAPAQLQPGASALCPHTDRVCTDGVPTRTRDLHHLRRRPGGQRGVTEGRHTCAASCLRASPRHVGPFVAGGSAVLASGIRTGRPAALALWVPTGPPPPCQGASASVPVLSGFSVFTQFGQCHYDVSDCDLRVYPSWSFF